MKAGQSSRTAESVCGGRAIAQRAGYTPRFSDETARVLLSETERARVDRFFADPMPRGLGARMQRGFLDVQSKQMAARTIAIDDAIREASAPQLVLLGAGLDGRAFRMAELAGVTVFEIDHPDTQREKRMRASSLVSRAKDLRFVPVDFTRDSLDASLESAGHDHAQPTTWIWEGVVMYLTPAQIEATLEVIAKRSAPKSRLVVLHHTPSPILWILGPVVRWMGEPLRSHQRPEEMRALLERFGFHVTKDRNMLEIGQELGEPIASAVRRVAHMRIAIADRLRSAR